MTGYDAQISAPLRGTVRNIKSKAKYYTAREIFTTTVLPFLCLLPFIFGLLSKLGEHIHEFIDAETIVCAGQHVLAHASPYLPGHCPGMQPARFVYPPITAWAEAWLQPHVGATGIIMVYGFLYFATFAAVLWAILRKDSKLYWRAPFLLCFSASGLLAGNISVIFHGAMFLVAISTLGAPILLLPVVVIAGILKPTFAVYSGVFLFHKRMAFPRRVLMMATAVTAILAVTGLTYHADPKLFVQWLTQLREVHSYFVQGHSIMVSLELLGIHSPLVEMMIYPPYAAVMLLAGLAVIHHGKLSPRDSILVGITVCLLLYPRLLTYDEYTLPFGLAVLAASWANTATWPDAVWVRRIVLGACAAFAIAGGFRGGVVLYGFSVLMLLVLAVQLTALSTRERARPTGRGFEARHARSEG